MADMGLSLTRQIAVGAAAKFSSGGWIEKELAETVNVPLAGSLLIAGPQAHHGLIFVTEHVGNARLGDESFGALAQIREQKRRRSRFHLGERFPG